MRLHPLQTFLLTLLALFIAITGFSQRYLSDYDSTLFVRDTIRPLAKRFTNLNISGYIQPQFQIAQSKGAPSFAGGNFSDSSDSRFMLRRARVKVDYILPSKNNIPKMLFTFQFDVTERGAFARDVFLRVYEPKHQNFSLTMGLMARPFGYEVNLSSGFRESPERGRMSQILMPTERDLGAMISYESQNADHKSPVKFDIGLYNGQGLAGTTDFDSYKDLISRLTLKPTPLSTSMFISGGLSFLNGGWMQSTKYQYEMSEQNGIKLFAVDSNNSNAGKKAPRHYYGADVQLGYKHAWGKTELRAEYWKGKQPGTAISTTNPGTLPLTPTYMRKFDGAFFYFLQNIINENWELVAKYDWYDPNTKAKSKDIGITNLTIADIKYSTIGIGLTRYFSSNLKLLAYYDFVRNEQTSLAKYVSDAKDNIFTLRMQLRF